MISFSERLKAYARKGLMRLGFDFYLSMDDRRIMEKIILPYFQARQDVRNVLFVGCDWYTRGYRKFFREKVYWTMDYSPSQAQFGSAHHVTDSIINIRKHFETEFFDLVICNGVYGYGLDSLDEFELAVRGIRECLSPGGSFILGWDDNPRRTPFPLESSLELRAFDPLVFAPLQSSCYLTANPGRHTFGFYEKPTSSPGGEVS